MTAATPSTLIFVDTRVDNYQNLIQGADPTAQVIVLDATQDGIEQISQVLAAHSRVSSVQIVSHGNRGTLQLGSTQLGADNLGSYGDRLQQWDNSLTENADILLYGCNVAAGDDGKAFVQQIAQLTGAKVAASENLTGNAAQGGDWNLEFATGRIQSLLAFQSPVLQSYQGVLQNYSVSTAAQLKDAINGSQLTPEDDTVTLNADINLTEELPALTSNLAFAGNSHTVNGGNIYRVFTVNSGTVSFSGLTIANGRAIGTAGTPGTSQPGGVGGTGIGGGLLINGGAVTLVNTNFVGNQAIGGNGGSSGTAAGGNGGNAQGGAIYVNAGSLRISTSGFDNNGAIAGTGGTGSVNGVAGQGKGGAVYVNTGTVVAEGNPSYSNNAATTPGGTGTDNADVFGTVTVVTLPKVTAITPAQPNPTAAATVGYTVTFDRAVTGVDPTDFVFPSTGNIVGAGIVSVTPDATNSIYTVALNTGSGNGTLQLNLNDNDSIKDAANTPLGATGVGNGNFAGIPYTINKTPPTVASITRKGASPTAAAALTYTVLFAENVSGVDAADFSLTATPGITGASITSVTPINGQTYDVVVNSGTGNGDLGLNLIDDDSIQNALGVVLGGAGAANGNFTAGQAYTINKTPPAILSINRVPADPNNPPTKSDTVQYSVTFSQGVAGVDASDFSLAAVGVSGAIITGVQSVDPATSTTYTVSVNTGTGDGSLGLNLADDDTIQNSLGVSLGGTGQGNGNFTGQAYTLLKSSPVVSAISLVNPNPTAANTVNYSVVFNQEVTGVDATDFALAGTGVAGTSITSVSGSGKTYTVAASTNGSGTLGLNLVDNDSIANAVNTPLGGTGAGNGSFAGQPYTVNKVPPRVASISRLETNPSNAASVNFAVIFSENVVQVDTNDFALSAQGLAGARITAITRVNGSFYTVAVSTGSGNGSVGLALADNDSILNTLGVPLGGTGASNGNFTGEVYSIDKAAPTVDIVDVAPDPRRDLVDSVTIRFSEAVSGFTLSDLRLTRDNVTVSLTKASLTSTDGINWTLGNLRKLTNQRGEYGLTLVAGESGIRDTAGNALPNNASDRWSNLATVNACLPGINRRGTRRADTLQGTEDNDTLQGLDGNDTLLGLDCQDRLVGDKGNDRLVGDEGNDTLLGGAGDDILDGGIGADALDGGLGADRFVYAGNTQAEALANSLVNAPDRLKGFKVSQGDKFQISIGNRSDRPDGLFNAGRVGGRTLTAALRDAYSDKNQTNSGSQALQGNEAVFFNWRGQTYLSVNDGNKRFSAASDWVVNVGGISLKAGDATAGTLATTHYFA